MRPLYEQVISCYICPGQYLTSSVTCFFAEASGTSCLPFYIERLITQRLHYAWLKFSKRKVISNKVFRSDWWEIHSTETWLEIWFRSFLPSSWAAFGLKQRTSNIQLTTNGQMLRYSKPNICFFRSWKFHNRFCGFVSLVPGRCELSFSLCAPLHILHNRLLIICLPLIHWTNYTSHMGIARYKCSISLWFTILTN